MLIFASTDNRGSQIFFLALYIWFYTRKKKYSDDVCCDTINHFS